MTAHLLVPVEVPAAAAAAALSAAFCCLTRIISASLQVRSDRGKIIAVTSGNEKKDKNHKR